MVTQGIDVVRVGYSDLIGTERGRDVLVNRFARTVGDGVAFCRSVYGTTPMGDVVDIEGGLEAGLPDVLAFPDVSTLQAVPWEPGVAHVIADVFNPDGSPSEESPRTVLKRVIEQFAELGMQPIVGPELEFYVLERTRQEPDRLAALRRGHRQRVRRRLEGRSGERAAPHAAAALGVRPRGRRREPRVLQRPVRDQSLALRGPRCRRPRVPVQERRSRSWRARRTSWQRSWPSRSTTRAAPDSIFTSPPGTTPGNRCSTTRKPKTGSPTTAKSAIAGVLAHAPALAAVCNPTINSYKRFGPDTLAPWLIDWGLDNRSAMVRIPPERGKASRMELRLGDASANPYLAIAGLLAAAYLGIRDKLEPPSPLEGYGYDPSKADKLPGDLASALDAFEADADMAGDSWQAVRRDFPRPTSATSWNASTSG